MKSSTVNISFNDELLKQIDRAAQEESRSRSELIREAARTYLEHKARWKAIFAYTEKTAQARSLTEADVEAEIAAYRQEKKNTKNRP